MIAEYIAKPRIGIILEKAFAKNATAVVEDVTVMARNDLLKVYAILLYSSYLMNGMN